MGQSSSAGHEAIIVYDIYTNNIKINTSSARSTEKTDIRTHTYSTYIYTVYILHIISYHITNAAF